MGLSSGLSQVGRFISPFIVGEMNDRGIHPFVAVSAVLMVLGVFPIFFIPETLKKQKQ